MAASADPFVTALVGGKYRIREPIARGGMGRVYHAVQAPLGRAVALKIVRASDAGPDDTMFLDRFREEASILAKLQHPNVVTIFDYGRLDPETPGDDDPHFIAMELLRGPTLAARLRERGTLSTLEVVSLTRQIAAALREVHGHGIVHRDLKPANVLLVAQADGSELVKLVDFGVGKRLARCEVPRDTAEDGMLIGTPKYMAPEQFAGEATTASDVHALASIAYQALTGLVPFAGRSVPELMVAKLTQTPPPVRHVNARALVPEVLEDLLARMLARRPEARPTASEVHAVLAVAERTLLSAPPGPDAPPLPKRRFPSSVVAWIGTACIVGLAASTLPSGTKGVPLPRPRAAAAVRSPRPLSLASDVLARAAPSPAATPAPALPRRPPKLEHADILHAR